MRGIGGGTAAIIGARAARAQAGKSTVLNLSVLAASVSPANPAVNVEEEPDMPPSPLTLGDGTEFEDTGDDPFLPDEDHDTVPEGLE